MIRASLVLLTACTFGPQPAVEPDGADDDGKADGGGSAIPWSVSRHVSPGDSQALVSTDLGLIRALGAKYVRSDLWWFAIEPEPGEYDQSALDYYRWYVEEAGRHGLGVVVILSNPPAWALDLYREGKREALADAFGSYAERVAETVGDRVTYYQLWNEPNNVNDVPDGDSDIAQMIAARAGLERGRATIGSVRPMRTIVNVLVDGHDGPIAHWEDDVRFLLRGGAPADVIAIDHYPGTWSIGDWGGNILDRLFLLGVEEHVAVAIFETGYATSRCAMPLNSVEAQASWVREQMPRIRAKLADPAVTRGVRFELANWYELDDRGSTNCFDPEDNFGIVYTDRSKKPAFAALADEIAKF